MSAPLIQPLPTATPSLAPGSSPLPTASPWGGTPVTSPWGGSPVPSEPYPTPVGRLSLPSWPEMPLTSQQGDTAPAAAAFRSLPSYEVSPPASFPAGPPAPFEPAPAPPAECHAASVPETAPPTPASPAPQDLPDFTDQDLLDAFAPIFRGITIQAAPAPIDLHLEPMLRATVRRALAEYSPTTGRPFTNPGVWDRFKWRMRALFTSRSYEDILFEKTNRFQVDEVFLLDTSTLALVSYASTNPGRHASAKRVENTVHRLALQLREANGPLRRYLKLPDDRNVIVREGSFVSLVAVFRGMPNEMAINDLGYTLSTIEDRFEDRYRIPGSPLLKLLQPFLEDCLLIQAPATAA